MLGASQFEAQNEESDHRTIKGENYMNINLSHVMKHGRVRKNNYHRLTTTRL